MRRLVSLTHLGMLIALAWADLIGADEQSPVDHDFNAKVEAALEDFQGRGIVKFPIGRTRQGTLIWCLAESEALNYRSTKQRVLYVGGLDGSTSSVRALTRLSILSTSFQRTEDATLAIVPIANPDGWAAGRGAVTSSGGTVNAGYPPEGPAYNSLTCPESQYLWRFIGWFAPDVVVECHDDSATEYQRVLSGALTGVDAWPKDSLAHALRDFPVASIGKTRVLRLPTSTASSDAFGFTKVPNGSEKKSYLTSGRPMPIDTDRSPLRQVMLRRLDRTPLDVAKELAQTYGGHLDRVMYQPALALVARLRLGELTADESHRTDVEGIVRRYVDGTKPSLTDKVSGSHLAGHLIFAELARLDPDSRYVDLVKAAADYGLDDQGRLRKAMPFHNEMSDAVFMACPILTAAGRYTGDDRYFEMAVRHLEFMTNLCVRGDGIYRHSPLCEAAWGRGNGFPALGLALCLADLDAVGEESSAAGKAREVMLPALRAHLQALVPHQDVTGMWHQVIDDPGSYREMTSTCMISYAIVRGIRSGWLDETKYAPIAKRAWEAVKVRIGEDGTLFDVCTGTGKQKTLWDYRDRTAILGKDERGGAMALLFAVEMAAWQSSAAVGEP